ncbi:pyrrolo-quinoline quinone [Arsenicitalea aurantiaca]|uniref:Pyrrolo-quinoline quinone n=1 Tax=Arsenicitalea aurantiaca TaxID=1783274 RepID=A0A433XB21_9HYPH|nr:PQQ-binding-like beta-propeller repeat protein [Arsenicitalea aurantiaca]RUT31262.1 pyrrolo-quinoline quinone [Arsenicitalea aurantiaca]
MNVPFKHALLAVTALSVLTLPALAQDAGGARSYAPVTNDMILNPPAEEWLMWRRTLDNQGFSPLDTINKDNVDQLTLAWAWPMAEVGQQETAPLVHDGIMFLSTNQNIVQALDAKTGDLIWEYRHVLPELPASYGYQLNQARRQKNSIALYDDKVILATVDAKLVSLDAATGQVVWETQVYDSSLGYSYTVGPIVVNDKIISAISGCSIAQTAGGCYIAAHDVNTGEEIWRFNTLDDPNNPEQQASWGDVPPENRWGGTPWATGSYDPRTNTTFWGIGMPGPYAELVRGSGDGDVLYTNATLALDADTGERKWHYSHLPRDNWDLDSPFERVLIDEEVDGEMRHLLVTVAGKNGIAFALDRDTGEYLWSKETVYQNVVTSIDADGRVNINEDLIPTAIGEEKYICTSVSGGKLWQAGAYSPQTKAFYVPLTEACNTVSASQSEFTAGNAVGAMRFGPRVLPEGIENAGVIDAFSVIDGEDVWRHEQRTVPTSSLLATAGGLVFGGDAGRFVKAFDDETGEVLWEQRLNAPIGGHPMTYQIDGEQYVVIPAGFSAQAGSSASMYPEVPVPSGSGNSIFVFKLPANSGN